ncbi:MULTISPECIES: hypothetical protein [Deinococcus]|uniref:Uncharacterized protein n=1 Tax=Deinococcus rufus TaxID=2136097 RepID=A0ABV7ZCN2_9DEIO|nr:hypothetical protein [Deinococcus sp. AB2017081]WQE97460.1 hypothetical protein U2P90_20100 [Deinococcus sp. AB2017081]WQE97483.1 hypothetical protein U2P90_19970 [Deinococcus sp. AB2017081]
MTFRAVDLPEQKKWLVIVELRIGDFPRARSQTALEFATREEAAEEVARLNREESQRLDALGYRDSYGRLIDPSITNDFYFLAHETDLAEIDWSCDEEM